MRRPRRLRTACHPPLQQQSSCLPYVAPPRETTPRKAPSLCARGESAITKLPARTKLVAADCRRAEEFKGVKEKSPDGVGALFSFLLCRVASSYYRHNPFADDSHRVRGVFSFVALLSPVESSKIPSGALGAHGFFLRLGDVDCKAFLAGCLEHTYPLGCQGLSCEILRIT
jgi:hypothetical protein